MAKQSKKVRNPPENAQELATIALADKIERLDLEFSELRDYVKRVMATKAARARRDRDPDPEPGKSPCPDTEDINQRIRAGLSIR